MAHERSIEHGHLEPFKVRAFRPDGPEVWVLTISCQDEDDMIGLLMALPPAKAGLNTSSNSKRRKRVTDRPILFKSNMVRAVLDGRKTQTRRLSKNKAARRIKCHDMLWVRESFCPDYFDDGSPAYMADWHEGAAEVIKRPKWKPSIHMPRCTSRISLFVTGITWESLQDISSKDARAEGCGSIADFESLWKSINGEDSWAENPLIIAISFQVVRNG